MKTCYILFILLWALPLPGFAQEETATTVHYGKRYIELNIKDLDKYNERVQRSQKRLLNKLSRKEARLKKQLKHNDSSSYEQLTGNSLSYDSIRTLLKADSNSKLSHTRNRANAAVDSLKKIQGFLQAKTGSLPVGSATALTNISTDSKLSSLQTDLNYNA
jgi:hypothetical protein